MVVSLYRSHIPTVSLRVLACYGWSLLHPLFATLMALFLYWLHANTDLLINGTLRRLYSMSLEPVLASISPA